MLIGKVHFSDGHTEDILNYTKLGTGLETFETESGKYSFRSWGEWFDGRYIYKSAFFKHENGLSLTTDYIERIDLIEE